MAIQRSAGSGPVDVERIADEVGDIAGVQVTIGRWEADEEAGEMEAVVHVAAGDVSEISRRLALHREVEEMAGRSHGR